MARGLAPDGRTKPGARVGWGAVAAGARALKEKAERSGASPCEFDYQVGRRGCLLLAIGPVREAQNPAASSRVLRASAVRSSTLYAIEDLRFTIYADESALTRRSHTHTKRAGFLSRRSHTDVIAHDPSHPTGTAPVQTHLPPQFQSPDVTGLSQCVFLRPSARRRGP